MNIRLNTPAKNIETFYDLYEHIQTKCKFLKGSLYIDETSATKKHYNIVKDIFGVTTIYEQMIEDEENEIFQSVCSFDNKGNYKTYFETV